MNTQLMQSKKFRAALIATAAGLISILSTRMGLGYDMNTCLTLAGTIMAPFLLYIGAEGYAEQAAKAAVEEDKSRKALSDQVLASIVNKVTPPDKETP